MSTKEHAFDDKIKFNQLTTYEKYIVIKLDELVTEYKKHCATYRFDLMAASLYGFIWNEYCDWYLEISKIEIEKGNEYTKNILIYTLQIILKLCHPIIPYITEELWKEMNNLGYTSDAILMNAKFPSQQKVFHDKNIHNEIDVLKNIINIIRKTRSDLNIHPKNKLDVFCKTNDNFIKNVINSNKDIIISLVKINQLEINSNNYNIDKCITVTLKNLKIFIPIKDIIDIAVEKNRLTKNLLNLEANLVKIENKLNNKNFIEKAPSNIIEENLNKKVNYNNEINSVKELLKILSN